MILFCKHFLLSLLLFVAGFQLFGQDNVSDCQKSREFARYLYFTKQYELARHELERVSYFCEFDSTSQLLLLQSMRKLKHYPEANVYFASSPQPFSSLSPGFRSEYIRLQMEQGYYSQVMQQIKSGVDFDQSPEHHLGILLLQQDWKQAKQTALAYSDIETVKMNALRGIANQAAVSKRKSTVLSTLLSVLVPGSGKMYCGYWGDGSIGFAFTASTTFFAYRAFNKYGKDNVYPWIISGLAASYYLGNIYGGYQAAERYNHNLNHKFVHETEHSLFSDY